MITKNLSIEDIISLNNDVSELIHKYSLNKVDENLSVSEFSESVGIDSSFFTEVLNIFASTDYFPIEQLKQFPVTEILDYLKKTHAHYLTKRLPEIELTIKQLENEIEDVQFNLLSSFFGKFKAHLIEHIQYEEYMLFPYIECVFSGKELPTRLQGFTLDSFVELHNDEIEDSLLETCQTLIKKNQKTDDLLRLKVLIHYMDLFEKDLRIHGRIEDEILIDVVKEKI